MTIEEFRIQTRIQTKNNNLEWKKKLIDPQMACFWNAMEDLRKSANLIKGQYHNNDKALSAAIQALQDAYENLHSAYEDARRDYNTIDDVVAYMRPDYVSVDNSNGVTSGNQKIQSFKVEADTDGVHMYITI